MRKFAPYGSRLRRRLLGRNGAVTDPYTKATLTVIAAALVTIAAQNALRPAIAQPDQIQKVQICDHTSCAQLRSIGVFTPGREYIEEWGLPVVPVVR